MEPSKPQRASNLNTTFQRPSDSAKRPLAGSIWGSTWGRSNQQTIELWRRGITSISLIGSSWNCPAIQPLGRDPFLVTQSLAMPQWQFHYIFLKGLIKTLTFACIAWLICIAFLKCLVRACFVIVIVLSLFVTKAYVQLVLFVFIMYTSLSLFVTVFYALLMHALSLLIKVQTLSASDSWSLVLAYELILAYDLILVYDLISA